MPESIKAALAWLYSWVTVITALIAGFSSFALPHLETLGMIDFGAFMSPETAMKVVTSVALLKWACVIVTTLATMRNDT